MSDKLILVNPEENSNLILHDELVGELSKGGVNYLPRISLVQGISELATSRKALQGNFAVVVSKTDVRDIGEQFIGIALVSRVKAITYESTPPLSYFKPGTPGFDDVKAKALENVKNYAVGYEYLIWMPDLNMFATYHLGTQTSRPETKNLMPLLGKLAKFKSEAVKGKKGSFYVPRIGASNDPVAALPPQEMVDFEVQRFMNPKDSEVEEVTESEGASDRD